MKELQLISVDLSELARRTVCDEVKSDNVKVSLDLAPGVTVMADGEQLSMAISNIIRNAVEAMPEGGTLTIHVSKTDDSAVLSVQDSGRGIPKENFQMLFEPLFTTKPGGVGFGLALAKTVVDRHNGTIEVQSKPGEGATFIIHLPSYGGD